MLIGKCLSVLYSREYNSHVDCVHACCKHGDDKTKKKEEKSKCNKNDKDIWDAPRGHECGGRSARRKNTSSISSVFLIIDPTGEEIF